MEDATRRKTGARLTRRGSRRLKDRLRVLSGVLPYEVDQRTYAIHDAGQRVKVPFTFFQEEGLKALHAVMDDGDIRPVVREQPTRPAAPCVLTEAGFKLTVRERVHSERLVVDWKALAAYQPPAGAATDEFTLTFDESAPSSRVQRNPLGTRLEPIAAEWLWDQRKDEDPFERSASAWCTACGRYFQDQRVIRGEIGRKPIARWCPSCHDTRKPNRPQLRACAAKDCDHFFEPPRRNNFYCSQRCEKREKYRRTLSAPLENERLIGD